MQWTEREIEDWLRHETRPLTLPSGRRVTHTTFRIVWQRYDGLRVVDDFTEAEIVGCAVETASLSRETFGDSFDWVVNFLEEQRHTPCGCRAEECPRKRDRHEI